MPYSDTPAQRSVCNVTEVCSSKYFKLKYRKTIYQKITITLFLKKLIIVPVRILDRINKRQATTNTYYLSDLLNQPFSADVNFQANANVAQPGFSSVNYNQQQLYSPSSGFTNPQFTSTASSSMNPSMTSSTNQFPSINFDLNDGSLTLQDQNANNNPNLQNQNLYATQKGLLYQNPQIVQNTQMVQNPQNLPNNAFFDSRNPNANNLNNVSTFTVDNPNYKFLPYGISNTYEASSQQQRFYDTNGNVKAAQFVTTTEQPVLSNDEQNRKNFESIQRSGSSGSTNAQQFTNNIYGYDYRSNPGNKYTINGNIQIRNDRSTEGTFEGNQFWQESGIRKRPI